MLTYKIMFQIFFVPKYFLVLKAVTFGTLLPEHPVEAQKKDQKTSAQILSTSIVNMCFDFLHHH